MKTLIQRIRAFVANHRGQKGTHSVRTPRPADHFSLTMEGLIWGGPTN